MHVFHHIPFIHFYFILFLFYYYFIFILFYFIIILLLFYFILFYFILFYFILFYLFILFFAKSQLEFLLQTEPHLVSAYLQFKRRARFGETVQFPVVVDTRQMSLVDFGMICDWQTGTAARVLSREWTLYRLFILDTNKTTTTTISTTQYHINTTKDFKKKVSTLHFFLRQSESWQERKLVVMRVHLLVLLLLLLLLFHFEISLLLFLLGMFENDSLVVTLTYDSMFRARFLLFVTRVVMWSGSQHFVGFALFRFLNEKKTQQQKMN